MAVAGLGQLLRQTRALAWKNLLLIVVRRPIAFLLVTYAIPLGLLALLLSIPSFVASPNVFGIGDPAPIKDLASTVDSSKKFIIVKPPGLGPDVDRVVQAFTAPLDKSQLVFLDDERDLSTTCLANLRGVSNCHVAVSFVDSPETRGAPAGRPINTNGHAHTWQYVVKADPARDDMRFDATAHRSDQENFYLPLQLAINNAITNSTVIPQVFMFTREKQEEQQTYQKQDNMLLVGQVYVFALFACFFFIVYRFTAFITADRDSGNSQLIDAMGGSSATTARVLSWLLVFDLACLPCFIVFGILHWHILFPSSSLGLLIGWQVLLGLAVNSSTIFAAAFFSKARVSAVYVMGAFLLLSIATQVFSLVSDPKPTLPGALALSLLFPSANHILFTQQMCLWEMEGQSADINQVPAEQLTMNSTSYGLNQAAMLGFLAVNIVIYPIFAIVVERAMHGIDFRKRTFVDGTTEPSPSGVVAETFDLKKRFVPSLLERIFCCGKRKTVTAVDGISFRGHKGQILSLLGPNGSGKTTTLHMMAGFITPTHGSVNLHAAPSQIGICPQRNILWDDLTVEEHVSIWSNVKAGQESSQELDELISTCDLELKRTRRAKILSGGQKRKLQLACMFVGNSSVCLIDECTSGLDPLSRRVIWEILLKQRSRRSIIFTTHFLDEVDVLADHIVILSKGKVRCQGAVAELKNIYGGGYKVLVPDSSPRLPVEHPSAHHQDSLVYTVPDSRSAAELSSKFTTAGVVDVAIAGPLVEDVFLNVADEPELASIESQATVAESEFKMTPGRVLPFWGQVWALFRKRLTVLRRFWWPYLYVLVLPLVITPRLRGLLDGFQQPSCANLEPYFSSPLATTYTYDGVCTIFGHCDKLAVAPPSAGDGVRNMVKEKYQLVSGVNESLVNDFVAVQNDRQQFIDYIKSHVKGGPGGVYMGSGSEAPVIAYLLDRSGLPSGYEMLNLYSQLRSNMEISSAKGSFAQRRQESSSNSGILYAIFFALLQAIYPAAFVLYPALEKARKVRALEYTNGVRRGPLWVAYGLFDFTFVLIIALGVTAIMSAQLSWNGPVWVMVPILGLYGLAALLLGYVIAHFTSGPLSAFLAMCGVSLLMFVITTIAFAVGTGLADTTQMDRISLGITYGLNLILPIGNLFRALLVGLNVLQHGCRNGLPSPPTSIYAYGGPILYLVIQVAVLLFLIVWIEGDVALFRRRRVNDPRQEVSEKGATPRSEEVEAETARVENSESDLLRALHISKSFGTSKALDDVTLGLPESDIMALIGPNGAGKSTLVNLIQSELSPDHGRVLIKGEDARTRSAQKHLGVCPQHDALDLMSTQEHLEFYARVKGIENIKGNVNHVMASLDLTPHASTLASKLSGGNKRKLNLAIALMGTPPVLVLDEPTSAMDAVAKRSFWKLIQKITPNRSLLLTTHSMEEADKLATRTAIISQRILAVGTTKALRDKYSNHYYVSLLLASAPNSPPEEMERVGSWVREHVASARLERDMLGGQVRFTFPGVDAKGRRPVARVIDLLERDKAALGLEYYSVGGATLESVFLSVVRENNIPEEDGAAGGNRLRRLFALG